MKLKRGFYDVFIRTCALNPTKIALRQYFNGTYNIYTYSELYGVSEYISQILLQFKCNKDVVGLVTERNVIVPCAIAAVHKCCNTFMFLDHSQNIETNDIKLKIIISIKDNNDNRYNDVNGLDKKPDKTISVFNYTINFYQQDIIGNLLNKGIVEEHSFIASTSGSTGEKKHIQVPVQCIQPNIDDLTKLFNILSTDIIYFSTPLTFDPSMVEILLAFKNGASLLIAPENIEILFPKNHDNSITVWQTTPSKFFQYSNNEIKNKILSAYTSLKILALGGEPLNGIHRLREFKHLQNKTRIFTLYGVTEMSCWACVAELDLSKIVTDREVPLGSCLSETQVHVDTENSPSNNSGKIILVSNTRRCIVLNKSGTTGEECSLKFIDTGDIGEINNGTIYYRGRKDDTIKRFGSKVNLQFIENSIMECPGLKTCSCVWLPKPMLLVLYFSSETVSSQELSSYINSKLEDKYRPDKIMKVDNLPINSHGKTSKFKLSKMFEKDLAALRTINPPNLILQEIKSLFNNKLSIDEIKDKTFISIGGTSFQAITMCNKLTLVYPKLGSFILPHLISNTNTVKNIMQIVENEYSIGSTIKKRSRRPGSRAKRLANNQNELKWLEETKHNIKFEELWKHDTGKCVDASPTLYLTKWKAYVTVSSHSGKIVVVDAVTGILQGTMKLNSRIEASIYCCDSGPKGHCGVVGAYDGTIICFTLASCEEIWRINIGYMIKSKATCCNGILYIASYDGKIRCIDIMNGEIKHLIPVTGQGISADIVLAKSNYIMVGTLSGVCAAIDTKTKKVAWCGKLSSPVFASPTLYDDDKYVVFAEVSGEIHCRTVEKGVKVWKYEGAKGNIFSSLHITNLEASKWQFVFGCHDNGVYSITVTNLQPCLQWRAELTSPVYATPCCLDKNLLIAVSTNGKLFLINSDNGTILSEYQFPNDTFSSPVVYDKKIFIGCRNDYLYCIKYSMNL